MALGEAIKEDFILIKNDPAEELIELDLPKSTLIDCCFSLPVLAKLTGGDRFTNDQSSVIYFYDQGITTASLNLQKWNGSNWVQVAALVDDTYGTNYPFGFAENQEGEKLLGYLIDWQKVLNEEGEGSYRIQTEETPIVGSTVNRYSFDWCLQTYTNLRADKTVRFDWFNTGVIGDLNDDKKVRDFGKLANGNSYKWFNSLRMPDALFGNNTSSFEREFVRYQSGAETWIKDEQVESYQLITGYYPEYLHKFIKVDLIQSDELFVTNYFSNANSQHRERAVVPSSDYAPNWSYNSKFASVEVTFEQKYQNQFHKRC